MNKRKNVAIDPFLIIEGQAICMRQIYFREVGFGVQPNDFTRGSVY